MGYLADNMPQHRAACITCVACRAVLSGGIMHKHAQRFLFTTSHKVRAGSYGLKKRIRGADERAIKTQSRQRCFLEWWYFRSPQAPQPAAVVPHRRQGQPRRWRDGHHRPGGGQEGEEGKEERGERRKQNFTHSCYY